ncbi:MAG TPA: hypothetical protein DIU39_03370 [Flavobacteriales bacterium]|nr:hypothetical protein [Flavobacteriales bacterium]|tara:strand:+ start:65 stop:520 length:456 start_codon:yes stop_codon:yes gene_type:complete
MNTIKYITFLFVLTLGFCNNLIAQSNTAFDSLKQKEVYEIINELKSNPIKVKVLSTCSTKPELCGTMVFGSVSLVKILEGKYIGESIYVASTCSKTNYQIGVTYKLNASFGPGFSVNLCNGKTYNSDWNYKLDENEHFLIFGSLNSISEFD